MSTITRPSLADTSPPPEPVDKTAPIPSHFVMVDGHRIHYVDEGSGPVILFVHAGPTWSYYYRDMVLQLRSAFRCIAFDYPGWGLSTAAEGFSLNVERLSEVCERFVNVLRLRSIVLAVHDSGGPVALGVATRRPELFRGFVIVSSFAWPLTEFRRVRTMLSLVSSRPFRAVNALFNLLPRLAVRFGPRRRRLAPQVRRRLVEVFRTWKQRDRVLLLFRSLVNSEPYLTALEANLRRQHASTPSLLMFGEVDPVRAEGFPERFCSVLPRHELAIISQEQHFAHLGAPEEVAERIRAFVTALPDGRPARE